MIKPKQFANAYFKSIQKNGANLSKKRKKEVKRGAMQLSKEMIKDGSWNEFDVFFGLKIS